MCIRDRLKLGRKIEITTRCKKSNDELLLVLDVSKYTENFIDQDIPLFLDDLSLSLSEIKPASKIRSMQIELGNRAINRAKHGTQIVISHLASTWSRKKVEKVFEDLARLQSIFDVGSEGVSDPFELIIYRDHQYEPFSTTRKETLDELLKNHSVLKIENGKYDEEQQQFSFDLNGRATVIPLTDPDMTGLSMFRRYFGKAGEVLDNRRTQCGSFEFCFFVFDFSNEAQGPYLLDSEEKKLIKEHRIYLYRDGIRVYPYGDPEDDWLQIDVYRGTIRASEFLSNDQVVGYVNITQAGNPELKDKTSREGLIDTGYPTDDFRTLLQLVLAWVRKKPYAHHREQIKTVKEVEIYKKAKVQEAFEKAALTAADAAPEVKQHIDEASRLYKAERRYLVQRAENTEHLAGVGLSVETASHDLMSAMHRSLNMLDSLILQTQRQGVVDKEILHRDLSTLRGTLSFIESQMKDLQLLFKSTKQRRKDIRVGEQLQKVQRLFQQTLDRSRISLNIEVIGIPLVAKTTEAVLLQLFLNLFDNAVYWLEGVKGDRRIEIQLNGDDCTLIFADSGPGFRDEDLAYIFEPFFSGKGEEGRGLGLYIARQLLERHEYAIDVADKKQKILRGANLVVTFVKGG